MCDRAVIGHNISSNSRDRLLVAHLPAAVVVMTTDGTIRDAVGQLASHLGSTGDHDTIGSSILDLFAPSERDGVLSDFHAAVQKHPADERTCMAQRRDGTLFPARIVFSNTDDHLICCLLTSAETTSQANGRFLASLSHAIRTPLNGIIGMTNLLCETPLNTEQRECLDAVKLSADSLLTVTNDLIDIGLIDSGVLRLQHTAFSPWQVVDELLTMYAPTARGKGLDLSVHVAPGVPSSVIGDAGRWRQVLINLLSNALKFTDHGRVVVSVWLDGIAGDDVLLHGAVRDTGAGIAVEKLNSLLVDYAQKSNLQIDRNGSGLGLAICAQLTTLMRGRIWAESIPGQGSAFHFTARVHAAPVADEPAPDAAATLVLHEAGALLARPLRILLAEDNAVNLKVAQRMLEKRGHQITAVTDGAATVQAWKNETFDLLLLDLQMPVMDGYQATARIRAGERQSGAHLPIIAMTAHALQDDLAVCLQAGMDGYVAKPISADTLFGEIERVLHMLSGITAMPAPIVQPFDLERARMSVHGDDHLLHDLIGQVTTNCTRQIERLHMLRTLGDTEGIRRASLTIKSLVGTIGAQDALQAAQTLEQLSHTGDIAILTPALVTLEGHLVRLLDALHNLPDCA